MSETVTVRDEAALVDVAESSGESEVASEVLEPLNGFDRNCERAFVSRLQAILPGREAASPAN